jgi:hypothetical protein
MLTICHDLAAGVHPDLMPGISYRANVPDGAFSIVLSGGYSDDDDRGSTVSGRVKKTWIAYEHSLVSNRGVSAPVWAAATRSWSA